MFFANSSLCLPEQSGTRTDHTESALQTELLTVPLPLKKWPTSQVYDTDSGMLELSLDSTPLIISSG